MAKELTFRKNESDKWESVIESEGKPIAVEINRDKHGSLLFYGSLTGMEKVLLENYGPYADKHQIVEIDVPSGVTITIESGVEVTSAKAE